MIARNAVFELSADDVNAVKEAILDDAQGVVRSDGSL